jgi:hypothetical protein
MLFPHLELKDLLNVGASSENISDNGITKFIDERLVIIEFNPLQPENRTAHAMKSKKIPTDNLALFLVECHSKIVVI